MISRFGTHIPLRIASSVAAGTFIALVTGCTSVGDKPSLTQEVTTEPSAAFMKKVANDPFPAAGQSQPAATKPQAVAAKPKSATKKN